MTEKRLSIRLAVIDGKRVEDRFKQVGDRGQEALKRIENATKPASRGLKVLDGATGDVRRSMEGMGRRLGPVGSALSRLGPAGIAAAAGIAAVTVGLRASIRAAEEFQGMYRRLDAVLKSTGQASGLTARQLADFAQGIEQSTLASSEAVLGAAGILATFRSVSGDTFKRTLVLAQDMTAVFGQDLKSSAIQLGKALEEPIQGISALRRVGVSFTQSQREMIRTLVETGQTAAAQKVILDALEQQVGGAGVAEATGVTGASNRLTDAWGDLLKAIGRTPLVSKSAEYALGGLGRVVRGLVNMIEPTLDAQIEKATRQLEQAERMADMVRERGFNRFTVRAHDRQVANRRAVLTALQDQVKQIEEENKQALEGQKQAEIERRSELLSEQRGAIDRMLKSVMTAPHERIAQINEELDTTRQRLNALRLDDNSNGAEVDSAIAQAEALARRRIDAIEEHLRAARARASEQEKNRILAEGERITNAYLSASEAYAQEIKKLDGLLAQGAVDAVTYARAVADAEKKKLEASTDWRDGAIRAMRDYVEAAQNSAAQAAQAMTTMLQRSEDAFVRWATTGKIQARDLFNTIAEEALRAAYRMAVVKPLGNIFETALGGIFGGTAQAATAHTGGVIGADRLAHKSIDMRMFTSAPKYHSGGLVGDEVPIIAKRGEAVFTPGQMRLLGGALKAKSNVNVSVKVENKVAGAEANASVRRDSAGNLDLNIVIEEVETNMARNIGRGEGLASTLERRYGLNPAAGSYR